MVATGLAAPANRLKAALARGDEQIGLWLDLANPTVAAIAAGAGFDWCVIDGEHGPNTVETILAQLQAMEGRGAEAVVRVPTDQTWVLKQVLDLGVQTVLVPMVDTPEQAARVVAACRYPPDGFRGLGAAVARAAEYGARADYARTANDQVCVIVQAETPLAMENIEAIAAVPGVDGVFIGPADLAANMGFLGNAEAPEVLAAIEGALQRIRDAGAAAGFLCFDIDALSRWRACGATMLGVGADAFLLSVALRKLAAEARDTPG